MKADREAQFSLRLTLALALLAVLLWQSGWLAAINHLGAVFLHQRIPMQFSALDPPVHLLHAQEPWLLYGFVLFFAAMSHRHSPLRPLVFSILLAFSLFLIEVAGVLFDWFHVGLLAEALMIVLAGSLLSLLLLGRKTWGDSAKAVAETPADSPEQKVTDALQSGDLEAVWQGLKQLPIDNNSLEMYYHLGCELERRELYGLAYEVFRRASRYDFGMLDLAERQQELEAQQAQEVELVRPLIGHYCLKRKIASGANSVVYAARDELLQKDVAVKIIKEHPAGDALSDLYLEEVRLTQSLDHPGIVRIHDAGQEDDRQFIVMDLLPGQSLDQFLAAGHRFADAELLLIAEQALQALGYAHSHKVTHADIKPANLIYDAVTQTVYITDFGAARRKQKELSGQRRIMGTPAYMAPEQLQGRAVDSRSDLYSLGVTLYQLSSGKLPLKARDLADLKRKVLSQTPDWDWLKDHHPCVAELLPPSLHKKPYERYTDAAQMLRQVQHCRQIMRHGSLAHSA